MDQARRNYTVIFPQETVSETAFVSLIAQGESRLHSPSSARLDPSLLSADELLYFLFQGVTSPRTAQRQQQEATQQLRGARFEEDSD